MENDSEDAHNDRITNDADMPVSQVSIEMFAQRKVDTYETHKICFSVGRGLM